jgi:hypothetical protein
MRKPDLSIIIVNWNTADDLRECLISLKESSPAGMEVIVVDNASSDKSAEVIEAKFPWARLIKNSENLGFSKACNQGIETAQGRYILLLNPDSIVQPGALRALIRFGDENPKAGIIGPKILNPDGSLQYSCRHFPTLQAGIFRNTILGKFFPNNPYTRDYLMLHWDHSETVEVDWVSGAALFIRRELLDDIGGLDERFFMYCEDVDIAYRAKQKGWRVMYFPGAAVIHARARSSDQNPNAMITEFHKSMYRFFKKHYLRDSSVFVRLLVPLGLIARASFFITRNYRNYAMSRIRRRMARGGSPRGA